MTGFGVFLILLGSLFTLASSLGIVRFPCTFTRAHALGVASTLGIFCVMSGVVLAQGALAAGGKAFLTVVFIFLTSPVGSHMLGRAAYLFSKKGSDFERDDLSGHIAEPEPEILVTDVSEASS
jgi:multicomponent Na+:H+ antiporter subunit G